MRSFHLLAVLLAGAWADGVAAQQLPPESAPAKLYRFVDGKVDARTYNGYRRYHASCNHCHGPDGEGSTFASSLIGRPPEKERFRSVVLHGQSNGASVMKGFAGDPNVEPYIDDIFAYLQARSDGVLTRGRPAPIGR